MQARNSAWKYIAFSKHRLLWVSFISFYVLLWPIIIFIINCSQAKCPHSVVVLLTFEHKYVIVHYSMLAHSFSFFLACRLNMDSPFALVHHSGPVLAASLLVTVEGSINPLWEQLFKPLSMDQKKQSFTRISLYCTRGNAQRFAEIFGLENSIKWN